MAGVVEEADGAGAGAFQSRAEFLNGSLHGDLIRVAARDHVESEAGQCIADQFRVVGGIGRGAAGIVAVADDQGDSGLCRLRQSRRENRQDQES